VINKASESSIPHITTTVRPFLEKRGVHLFGVLQKDRLLEAVTVRLIVKVLNGEVLCCERSLDEFVENFLIGAMDPDNALKHFSRIQNKAVITGSHRTDIMISALETSTHCVIITGGLRPSDIIIGKAISKGIPIISVAEDTFSTVNTIEAMLGRAIIREEGKVQRARDLIEASFDVDGFIKALKR
jgi:BioD-like phosphotransacetylase family protein